MSPRNHTALADTVEFDRVRAVWQRLGRRMGDSGDDCAFVPVGGTTLALSSDMSVEGVHFRPGWLAWDELGYRAAVAALSDLAAVAAAPVGLMVSIGVSDEVHADVVPEIMAGIGSAATLVEAKVLGGDTVRADKTVIDVTVVGRFDGKPVRRTGAVPGDQLFVTGALGGPGAAVLAWEAGSEPTAWARSRFAAPVPRVAEGQWLRGHGATSLIDVSDGLAPDAANIAAASGVECVIALGETPAGFGVDRAAALVSGEEYELLVTLPAGDHRGLMIDFGRTFGVPLTRVGHCAEGNGVRVMDGAEPVDWSGFRHFT